MPLIKPAVPAFPASRKGIAIFPIIAIFALLVLGVGLFQLIRAPAAGQPPKTESSRFEQAIQHGDLKACGQFSEAEHDNCIVAVALELKDPAACDGITAELVRSDCKARLESAKGLDACAATTGQATLPCFSQAIATADIRSVAACTTVKESAAKDICILSVVSHTKSTAAADCAGIQDADLKATCRAMTARDAHGCAAVTAPDVQANCYTTLATLTEDLAACEAIADPALRDGCYFGYAITLRKPDACDRMTGAGTTGNDQCKALAS